MQADKKQIEILLIDYFREYYEEFPKGKVVPSESPDFIVKMKIGFDYRFLIKYLLYKKTNTQKSFIAIKLVI